MYAIIKTGGKQYRVAVGDVIDVELLETSENNNKIEFSEVLFASDGSKTQFGKPSIPDFLVHGEVMGTVSGEKITSMKYKPSHNQRRRWGHRQKYTRVKITGIGSKRKEGRHGT